MTDLSTAGSAPSSRTGPTAKPHPWLPPSAATVAAVSRARATAALKRLAKVPLHRIGARWSGWWQLLGALPTLLRTDSARLLDAVGRVDVLAVLLALADESVPPERVERALVTLWLAISGHPALTSPVVLPGPFEQRVVDPNAPRLLALGNARGLVATAKGPMVISGNRPLAVDSFMVAPLAEIDGTVIVTEDYLAPDPETAERVRTALTFVRDDLPGGGLERVTIRAGTAPCGEAAYREARVGPAAPEHELVASAQAGFVRTAAAVEPPIETVLGAGALRAENGRRLSPLDLLVRACGNAAALAWHADRAAVASTVADDLEEVGLLSELTASGTALVDALQARAAGVCSGRPRALLVNVDDDDFAYSYQFGQSVERRCVERGLLLDRVGIDLRARHNLEWELGHPVPAPAADGIEALFDTEDDPHLAAALRRLAARRYAVVVANVRPPVFFEMVAAGLPATRTLVWDRHLHDGFAEERLRRGAKEGEFRGLPVRVWPMKVPVGPDLHPDLVEVGLVGARGQAWPMDMEFFRSASTPDPDRVFVGGDSKRDWPLFMEVLRDLPLRAHLVTAHTVEELAPGGLGAGVQVDARLSLSQFRDAMAAASITAIPLLPGVGATGLTVLTMAMALGVAVVATETVWIAMYARHEEEALLVPAGDAAAFREALLRLHGDAGLRQRLVANARRRVAEMCDLEAFTREMFATLD